MRQTGHPGFFVGHPSPVLFLPLLVGAFQCGSPAGEQAAVEEPVQASAKSPPAAADSKNAHAIVTTLGGIQLRQGEIDYQVMNLRLFGTDKTEQELRRKAADLVLMRKLLAREARRRRLMEDRTVALELSELREAVALDAYSWQLGEGTVLPQREVERQLDLIRHRVDADQLAFRKRQIHWNRRMQEGIARRAEELEKLARSLEVKLDEAFLRSEEGADPWKIVGQARLAVPSKAKSTADPGPGPETGGAEVGGGKSSATPENRPETGGVEVGGSSSPRPPQTTEVEAKRLWQSVYPRNMAHRVKPEEKRKLIREKLAARILGQKKINEGFLEHPDFRWVFRAKEEELLAKALRASVLAESLERRPLDPRSYYESHRKEFAPPPELNVRQILVRHRDALHSRSKRSQAEAKKLAQSLLARLRAGESFQEVAGALSSEDASGELGWLPLNSTIDPLLKDALTGAKDPFAGPVATRFGIQILEIVHRRQPPPRPFDSVKEALEARLRAQRRKEVTADLEASLKRGLELTSEKALEP